MQANNPDKAAELDYQDKGFLISTLSLTVVNGITGSTVGCKEAMASLYIAKKQTIQATTGIKQLKKICKM